jgi:hypothetical protein
MEKSGSIAKDQQVSPAQNLKVLLEKGIGYAQEFSGKVWTDYNFHDPGVTILEQYCYGLTELGYKVSFAIEDLLADTSDGRIDWEKNSFYSPALVFSSHPFSSADFRKLLIDTFSEIQNCWVVPVYPQGKEEKINGVYQVAVLPSLVFQKRLRKNPDAGAQFLEKLGEFLKQIRNLGEDFDAPTLLQPKPITLGVKIEIVEDCDVDQVMAEIIFALEVYLYHPVAFSNIEELQKQGFRMEEIFDGPRLTRGFIKDSELKRRSNSLHAEKFLQLISKISSVKKSWNLILNRNEKEKILRIPDDSYASINTDFNDPEGVYGTIQLFINGNLQRLNKARVSDLLLGLWSKNFRMYQVDLFRDNVLDSNLKGRFRNPKSYLSIQHHFPGIYGLSKEGISSHEPLERHAKVRQLKGYLMLMERHLANFLAQLGHLSDFFDPSLTGVEGSYYAQDFETKIDKDELEIKSMLYVGFRGNEINRQTGETRLAWLKRKNRVLDHLLSRFGEEVNDQPFQLLLKLNLLGTDEEMLAFLLLQKSQLLRQIADISYGRHRANFRFSNDENSNSVLEKLLELLMGIKPNQGSLIPDFLPKDVKEQNIEASTGLVKSKISYQDLLDKFRPLTKKESHFPRNESIRRPEFSFGKIGIKELYQRALSPDCYWISKKKSRLGAIEVIFQKSELNWVSVWEGDRLENALEAISKTINYFRNLNSKSEGMYLIDHILLRPIIKNTEFGFVLRDEWGEPTFQSVWVNSIEERTRLLSDFYKAAEDPESYREDGASVALKNANGESLAVFQNPKSGLKKIIDSTIELSYMMSGEPEVSGHLSLMELERLRLKGTLHREGIFMQRTVAFRRRLPDGMELDESFFDLKASLVLPDWPARFQEKHFKYFLENEVRERIPAHMEIQVHWLDLKEFISFEATYHEWLATILAQKSEKKQIAATLELYKFLSRLKGGENG